MKWRRTIFRFSVTEAKRCAFRFLISACLCLVASATPKAVNEPISEARQEIDRLAELANEESSRPLAISKLKGFVQDGQIGLEHQQHALVVLGDLGLQELSEYFLNVARGIYAFDNAQRLRGLAHLAHWKTRVAAAPDDATAFLVLEEALEAQIDGMVAGHVQGWASSELCSRGASQYFEKIVKSIKGISSGERALAKIDLCRKQIEVLSQTEDRTDALAHVVLFKNPETEEKLVLWAVRELIKVNSVESESTIIAYILRLQKELQIEKGNFVYMEAFEFLRKRGWTDERFEAVEIEPMHWI